MIMDGELDHLPEAAFNLKGTIEDAIEAGKMLASIMHIEIVSPEATLFSGEVESVIVPGSTGSFQMLNNHHPLSLPSKRESLDFR